MFAPVFRVNLAPGSAEAAAKPQASAPISQPSVQNSATSAAIAAVSEATIVENDRVEIESGQPANGTAEACAPSVPSASSDAILSPETISSNDTFAASFFFLCVLFSFLAS